MEGAAGRDLGRWDHGTVSFESLRDRRRTLSARQWAEAGYKRPRPQSSLSHGSNYPMSQIPRFTGNCPNFRNFFRVIGSASVIKGVAKIGDPKSKNQQRMVPRPRDPRPSAELPLPYVPGWRRLCLDLGPSRRPPFHRLNFVELRWTCLLEYKNNVNLQDSNLSKHLKLIDSDVWRLFVAYMCIYSCVYTYIYICFMW